MTKTWLDLLVLLVAMFFIWGVLVFMSYMVYLDAREHHLGPTAGQEALTPGAEAALVLWLNVWALALYVDKRKKLIARAAEHPSNESGLNTYIANLAVFTSFFPIIAAL